MNGPTAAVVIFFLLMCVKRLLLSLTPLLWYDTHTPTHTHTHKQLCFIDIDYRMLRALQHTIWSDLSRKCCYVYTPDYYLIFNSIPVRVSVCVCLSVCLCTNVKAMLFDRLPPNLIHTLKIYRGRLLSQIWSATLIRRASLEGPLFVGGMAFCTTGKHDRLAKHKLSTPLRVQTQNHSCTNAAAAEPVPVVHTVISRDM